MHFAQPTVLVGNDLPELGTDLVAALPSLNVDDLAHTVLGFLFVAARFAV